MMQAEWRPQSLRIAQEINETSSSRRDGMPYGGVKDSGFGREGPRYALREMADEKVITVSL